MNSHLECNLFTIEPDFINLYAVITFMVQVVIMHNKKILTHIKVLNVLNFAEGPKEGQW